MSWLLKVVEGPVKGAEVALPVGSRVRVGSSSACDIVLSDVSLAAEAFQLDVSEAAVTLIAPDGAQTVLKPFEIHDFGTTAIAVGPADTTWEELVRPAPEPAEEKSPETAPVPEPGPAADPVQTASDGEQEKSWFLNRWLWGAAALVLILILIAFVWWILCLRDGAQPVDGMPTERTATLEELAGQYGLRLEKDGDAAVLAGNLRRRTERLAIHALALAADSSCRIRLTDDETMQKASDELLFAYTDGTLKAVAASNGLVTIVGHAPDAAALGRALRTLDADVKGIVRVDASGVTVGGIEPPPQVEPVRVAFRGETTPAAKPAARQAPRTPRRDYPIAGILTKPYPCVVMRDGQRVLEGALIGSAVLVKIESDRLVLKDGGTEFDWRP